MKNIFKSKKFLAVLLILIHVFASLLSALYFFYKGNTSSLPFFEILYYTTQILASIFVTSGVIIAVWQYYLTSQAHKKSQEIERVQKAIDLSEYYKDNILNRIPVIFYVFDQAGAANILKSIRPSQYKNFDKKELDDLFTPVQIEELKKIQDSDIFLSKIIEANEIFNLNLSFSTRPTIIKYENEEYIALNISNTSIAIEFMSNLINKTLNNMEYFALHFKHQTADESVIYQSLHQSYLKAIPYLYYYIANSNTDPSNKLYTNVIWLYNEWMKEKRKQNTSQAERDSISTRDGTIIEVCQ